ncbi:MAG: Rossmann-like and DUF2520 domain-containing protein [Flavobacteriaceae bacterium]
MIRVVLCGTGNVAHHLFNAFRKSGQVDIVQVAGRDKNKLEFFGKYTRTTTDFRCLEKAEVYILAVSDDIIENLSSLINRGLMVHTSGSTSINKLPEAIRRGVFYPLQTFSAKMEVDFNEVPICLEAEHEEDYLLLEKLATAISNRTERIDSAKRFKLHTAAVFVNNFSNHLWHIGQELCAQESLSTDLLTPLIIETARKLEFLRPYEAQTGPARRKDVRTIQKQMEALEKRTHSAIYKEITQSIQESYAKEL